MSNEPQSNAEPVGILVPPKENPIMQDDSFSFDGYEVVHGEFFTRATEPYVTFNHGKVLVNATCLRKVPDLDYVQFMVKQNEKRFVIRPCSEETVNSFRWAAYNIDGWRHPKAISSKIFYAKIMDMMNWDASYRYRILGKLIRANDERVFVFDLTSAEAFRQKKTTGSLRIRQSFYPEEWRDSFGIPANEYRNMKLVDIVDEYTVLQLDDTEVLPATSNNTSTANPALSDNTTDQEPDG